MHAAQVVTTGPTPGARGIPKGKQIRQRRGKGKGKGKAVEYEDDEDDEDDDFGEDADGA